MKVPAVLPQIFEEPIPAAELAFDIDGVVADTMALMVTLGRREFGLTGLRKDDIWCYDLTKALRLDPAVLRELVCLTLSDENTLKIPAMADAPQVLTELGRRGPLRFITARIWPESITEWLHRLLPEVPSGNIVVKATGDPAAKLAVLREMGVNYFLEDRAETCAQLAQEGIHPLLFDQPWNRDAEGFVRVSSWLELRGMIADF